MGRIGAAHGLNGQVRLTSFTRDPLAIAAYGPLTTSRPGLELLIERLRPVPGGKSRAGQAALIAKFSNIDDRTGAERLNGLELFVTRDALSEGCKNNDHGDDEFFHVDLIGLSARLEDGTCLGKVVAVQNYGAGDLLEIRERSGRTVLFSFTREVVPRVNVDGGFVIISPPGEMVVEQEAMEEGKGSDEF